MNTQPNDGGPAFPTRVTGKLADDGDWLPDQRDGMSLRDWFAGQALTGLLACTAATTGDAVNKPYKDGEYNQWAAQCCYAMADAMLAARAATSQPPASDH